MQKNFNRSYYGNTRAPIGFHVQTAWFVGQDWHFEGYKMFLDYALAFDDVYIVPIRDGIEYMKNPVPVSELPNFEPFGCDNFPVFDCPQPQSCRYEFAFSTFRVTLAKRTFCPGTRMLTLERTDSSERCT